MLTGIACLFKHGCATLQAYHEGGIATMLNENIKTLRKAKGLTQEDLAARLHVVRQTVSKWEKGLSVPDADTLQKLAEELEVEVSQLLGAEIPAPQNNNEIAQQLAAINEQLVSKNRRSRRVLKIIGIVALAYAVIQILLFIATCSAASCYTFNTKTGYDECISYSDIYLSDSDVLEIYE